MLVKALLKGHADPASVLSPACTGHQACKQHLPGSQAVASANRNFPVFWFCFVFLISKRGEKGGLIVVGDKRVVSEAFPISNGLVPEEFSHCFSAAKGQALLPTS